MADKDGAIGTLVEEYQDRNGARKDKMQPNDFPSGSHSANVFEV